MRYARLQPKKIAAAAGFLALIVALTALTFGMKARAYGDMPFFNSLKLFAEQQMISVAFAARHYGGELLSPPAAAASEPPARAIPVLTYHRLALTQKGGQLTYWQFMDQMEALYRAGWRTATIGDYEAFMRGDRELPERTFILTFDDGAQQSYYPTDPVLRMLGYSAVEYVIVAGSETPKSTYYLSPEQIEKMLKTGRWEIGSHSFDAHRPYPTDAQGDTGIFYSDKLWLAGKGRLETDQEFADRVRADLMRSRAALEKRYGVTVDTFAVPFGGETGNASANNYPSGNGVTLAAAAQIYDTIWQQTPRRDFTYNYPAYASPYGERIHVDFDWSGKKLLAFMEGGLPKSLPYDDDFSSDRGWRQSWGSAEPAGGLTLKPLAGDSGASTILDGSLLWNTYRATATVTWERGYAELLGAVENVHTYRSCTFYPGQVAISDVMLDTSTTIAKASAPVAYGAGIRLGIEVGDRSISCLYNGRVVLSSPTPENRGGVGIQTWAQSPAQALLLVSHFSAQPLPAR